MAEKRLIDANALINVLHAKLCSIDNGRTMMQAAIPVADGMRIMELEYCIGLIQCADIIDAVPVVRCRECKYARPLVQDEYVECIMWCRGSQVDGFCHMGAKMDGGAE